MKEISLIKVLLHTKAIIAKLPLESIACVFRELLLATYSALPMYSVMFSALCHIYNLTYSFAPKCHSSPGNSKF